MQEELNWETKPDIWDIILSPKLTKLDSIGLVVQ